jgi:hypothetical protein
MIIEIHYTKKREREVTVYIKNLVWAQMWMYMLVIPATQEVDRMIMV